MSISVSRLSKHFAEHVAVDAIDFEVLPGEIFGLIGPNGAGKTTTMRMLVGLLCPSGGEIAICGLDIQKKREQARKAMGFVSNTTGLYERLTAREILHYYGRLYGVNKATVSERMALLAEALQMTHLLDRRAGTMSTGERQRVSLARASIHQPQVLILDEPTAGLDVLASRFVADFIRLQRDEKRTVLFSTHYMTEAELLCDRIALLHRGRLRAVDTPAAIKDAYGANSLEEVFLKLESASGSSDTGEADTEGKGPASESEAGKSEAGKSEAGESEAGESEAGDGR